MRAVENNGTANIGYFPDSDKLSDNLFDGVIPITKGYRYNVTISFTAYDVNVKCLHLFFFLCSTFGSLKKQKPKNKKQGYGNKNMF